MGFLKRASERSQQAIWEQVDLRAGERPINYAHLACVFHAAGRDTVSRNAKVPVL
jgi:hypothetical protein